MATDLRDRLGDLAAHTRTSAPPGDLWVRGVRRRRLAHATSAALVAVLVLLVGAGGVLWRADHTRIEPAAPQGAPHLPDRFYLQPSPWLHSFAGPPGPLVLVFPTVRNTFFGIENGIVGVTGSTGTYGFLDLPSDAVTNGGVIGSSLSLSPDGRHVAFWVVGTPSGSPNTMLNDGSTITGVGTYDTVTGQTKVSRISTTHGLTPSLLLWSDDSTLVLAWGQIAAGDHSQNSTTSRYDRAAVWNVAWSRPRASSASQLPAWPDNSSTRATDGFVVSGGGGGPWHTLVPGRPGSGRSLRVRPPSDLLVPSPDHRRVVGVLGHNVDTGPLAIAPLPPADAPHGAVTHLRRITAGHQWFRPLAWVDANHVAALRRVVYRLPDGSEQVGGEIDLVDVRSGTFTELVSQFGANGTNDSDPWLATSYLGAPVVHATPPPRPWDPRWVWGLGSFLFVVLGLLGWGRLRGRRA
jgi:hypothetical protein